MREDKYASFSLQAQDYRLVSPVATVTINIKRVNDVPVAADVFVWLHRWHVVQSGERAGK